MAHNGSKAGDEPSPALEPFGAIFTLCPVRNDTSRYRRKNVRPLPSANFQSFFTNPFSKLGSEIFSRNFQYENVIPPHRASRGLKAKYPTPQHLNTLHPRPLNQNTLHPNTTLPTPYTPAPYTLHPQTQTPCTLTPHTQHPTPYTLHPTPCTLHPKGPMGGE